MKKMFWLFLCLTGLLASSARATLYFYDGFDYTAGTELVAASGGAWKSAGTGQRPYTNASGNIAVTGLQAPVGGQVKFGGNTGQNQTFSSRAITNEVAPVTNLYMSGAVNITSVSGWGVYANSGTPSFTNILFGFATRGGVMLRADGSDGFNVGLVQGSGDSTINWGTNKYSLNSAHFVVLGATNVNVSRGLSIWVDPSSFGGDAPEVTITEQGNSWANQTTVLLGNGYSGTTSGQLFLDEVRVGNTWADVAPAGYTDPALSCDSILTTGVQGDGKAEPGEPVKAYITITNKGTSASSVTGSVTSTSSDFIISGSPASFGNIGASSSGSNSVAVTLTASSNALPGTHVFSVTNIGSVSGGTASGGSFTVEVVQVVSASPGPFDLVSQPGSPVTATLAVTNTSLLTPLVCSFSSNASWLTVSPASITIAPNSVSNITLSAVYPSDAVLTGLVSAAYNRPAPGFTNFTVNFTCLSGPNLEHDSTLTSGTYGDGKAEPGETINAYVTLHNNGAAAYGVTGTVTSASAFFTVGGSPAAFGNIASAADGSNSVPFTLTAATNVPPGTYVFGITNLTATNTAVYSPGAFTVEVVQVVSASPGPFTLSAPINQSAGTVLTVTNSSTTLPLICAFSTNASWLTVSPASVTIPPGSVSNINLIAMAGPADAVQTGTVTAAYSIPGPGFTNFTVVLTSIAPKPLYLSALTVTTNGSSLILPGDIVNAYITLTNSGSDAQSVSANVLSTNALLPVGSGSPASFGNIAAGMTASNTVPVVINVATDAVPGTYTFSVTNIAAANGGASGNGTFSITVATPPAQDLLAAWNFWGLNVIPGVTNPSPVAVSYKPQLTAPTVSCGPGLRPEGSTPSITYSNGWAVSQAGNSSLADAIAGDDYITIPLSAPGYNIHVTNIHMLAWQGSTYVSYWAVMSSDGGFIAGNEITNGYGFSTSKGGPSNIVANTDITANENLEIRLYVWRGNNAAFGFGDQNTPSAEGIQIYGSLTLAATNPILSYATNSITDGDGDGRFEPGEINAVHVQIANTGTAANDTGASVVPQGAAASHFGVVNSPNSSFGTIPSAGSGSNSTPFLIAATNPAVPLGTYTFAVTSITSSVPGTVSSGGTFQIRMDQGFAVQGQDAGNKFYLAAATNGITTNALMVITNGSGMPLVCTFTESAPWLTLPGGASLTVDPHSASNVLLVGGPTAASGQYTTPLTVAYNQAASNFTAFTVQFDVGPKIEPLVNDRVITEAGGVNNFPGQYEPGEILSITIPSTNNGAIAVSSITNTLTGPYFSASPASAVYPSMAVGDSTSTTYQVTIANNAPHGTHTLTARNAAGGSSWSGSFTLDVFNQAIPSVQTSLTIIVTQNTVNAGTLLLTNAGNASITYSISDNGLWDTTYTVSSISTQLVAFTPIFDVPNTNNVFVNWINNSTPLINFRGSFPLYGTVYTNFSVSRYGVIGLGTTAVANTSGSLPFGTAAAVAPFWTATAADTNSIRYLRETNRLVVAWGNGTGGRECQAWLYTNGQIRYLYSGIWSNGAVGVQNASNSLNIANWVADGSTRASILLTPRLSPWVTNTPSSSTLAGPGVQEVTFTANAAGRSTGTNNYTAFVKWANGTTSSVAVTVIVVSAPPPEVQAAYLKILPTDSVSFMGLAGAPLVKTNVFLVNTGNVDLVYAVTDVGRQSAGLTWTNTTYGWQTVLDLDANRFSLTGGDDEGYSPLIPIGFPFPFYGSTYTQLCIGVNGGIVLGEARAMPSGSSLASAPDHFIAPYWGDLIRDSNAGVRYSGDANELTVTWENMQQQGGSSNLTFQAVLKRTGVILFRYQSLNDTNRWPSTPIGLKDSSTRMVNASLSNAMTTYWTSTIVMVETNRLYDTPQYLITTNWNFWYTNTVTAQALQLTPGSRTVITVEPLSGTIVPGGTNRLDVIGDARDLTAGGTNFIVANAEFAITYPSDGAVRTNSLYAGFGITNSATADFPALKEAYDVLLFGSDERIISVVQNSSGSRTISWAKPKDSISRTYTVWYTTNLLGSWTWLADVPNGTSYTDADPAHANLPVIYYKVTVQ